jgi:LmbE family N-acetylglucosaminyl deacetylase
MTERRKLLGVFAHPDDESYGAGGTLARYAEEGADVYAIIATDGAAGSVSTSQAVEEGQTLTEIRAAELATAASILGLTDYWNLGYHDSGMRGSPENDHPRALMVQPLDRVVHELVGLMRRLRPQVVITHDPYGGYGHPDHIQVSRTTTKAFEACRAGPDPGQSYTPQKLYYTTFDRRGLRFFVKLMLLLRQDPTAFGRNKDIDLLAIAETNLPVSAKIDTSAYSTRREEAIQAHASQYSDPSGMMRVLNLLLNRFFSTRESYSRAFPPPGEEIESDLFAGIPSVEEI